MNPKQETIAAYEAFPKDFDVEFERHMRLYNMGHVERFLCCVRGASILDLGAGPGNYAAEFADRGFDVLCGDLSPRMVEYCRRKGLAAEVLDIETFDLQRRFNGIWANAVLLHLPKTALPSVFERIAQHLVPGGVFACSVKEGEGEGLKDDPDYPGTRRFFSYYAEEEFRTLLMPRFAITAFERTPSRSGQTVFIKYLTHLRPT
ncbi:MAG: class I SAM-dependent methyltransferase [Patescibacteria group bacterium]|nr:MAG: class I SAM-dependent methyltransferase [Patescibacteria group bacterium]